MDNSRMDPERSMTALSVILPVFNAEKYLTIAIESILNQSFPDFELIAVNDGSTDSSAAILENYAEADSRIRLVSRQNKGLIYSLNEAGRLAESPYLVRMDADDICELDRFEKQHLYMEKNKECVALGGRALLIDDANYPIKEMGEHLTHSEIDDQHLRGQGGAIIHPAAIIRKTAWEQVGGYHDEFTHAEDLDLFLRLAEIGKLANLSSRVLSYRQHMESIGYQQREKQYASAVKAVTAAIERRDCDSSYLKEIGLKEAVSAAESHRKWAWWALDSGNLKTARKYAWKSMIQAPYSIGTWNLVLSVIRYSISSLSK